MCVAYPTDTDVTRVVCHNSLQNRERYILTIGTESKSWWLEHGIGCIITNNSWLGTPQEAPDSSRPIPPEEFVQGCLLQYYYVEVIHAAVQVLLAVGTLGMASLPLVSGRYLANGLFATC